jgi:hypothetical protein
MILKSSATSQYFRCSPSAAGWNSRPRRKKVLCSPFRTFPDGTNYIASTALIAASRQMNATNVNYQKTAQWQCAGKERDEDRF